MSEEEKAAVAYVAALIEELRGICSSTRLATLAYILAMAAEEARCQASR